MRRLRFLLPLLASGLFIAPAGCRARPQRREEPSPRPPPDLQVVAVLPFVNESSAGSAVAEEFADVLASEWVKVAGVRTVRPRSLAGSLEQGVRIGSLEEALRVARGVKADAFVVASLTDYDPYEPPRLGVSIQFFRVSARPIPDSAVDRLVQSASWRCGPLPAGRDRAGHWITAFEQVYDAHDRRVRDRLEAYARSQEGSDTAFDGGREFTAVQSRYMQFVSNQLVLDILRASRDDEP